MVVPDIRPEKDCSSIPNFTCSYASEYIHQFQDILPPKEPSIL
jgi:hypothetical protein